VSDAAWGSDWIGTPTSFQKSLIFVIATSKREFTLTAGGFVTVSRESMLKVSAMSLSSLCILGWSLVLDSVAFHIFTCKRVHDKNDY
jgi:hypothetical protein